MRTGSFGACDVAAGSIASSHGNASVAPAPRSTVRREIFGLRLISARLISAPP